MIMHPLRRGEKGLHPGSNSPLMCWWVVGFLSDWMCVCICLACICVEFVVPFKFEVLLLSHKHKHTLLDMLLNNVYYDLMLNSILQESVYFPLFPHKQVGQNNRNTCQNNNQAAAKSAAFKIIIINITTSTTVTIVEQQHFFAIVCYPFISIYLLIPYSLQAVITFQKFTLLPPEDSSTLSPFSFKTRPHNSSISPGMAL